MSEPGIVEVQSRVFVPPEQFRATVAFYIAMTGGRCSLHFPFPERGLELASVSSPGASFLIIAGTEAALAPFRATVLTVLVTDIAAAIERLVTLGASVVQGITPVPTGFQTRLRHPDGLVVEYVQHTAAADRFRSPQL
ncbi:MAG TPA: VOC family protein [Stellaceae bacterium]|nr:VOC family protein [Stellaceae bacterium]